MMHMHTLYENFSLMSNHLTHYKLALTQSQQYL